MKTNATILVALTVALASGFSSISLAQESGPKTFNVKTEWQKPFDAVYAQLEKNIRPPNRVNPFYHAHPGPLYPGVYMWDSAFISLIWKDHNVSVAEDIIRSVLYRQQPDGRIPQVVGPIGPNNNGISNPAVVSYAASEIAAKTNNAEFVRSVYPALKKAHAWRWANRKLKNGLFFWLKPYESGIDNSPRFSNRDESKVADTTQVAASDASAYAVLDSESLVKLARMRLGAVAPTGLEAKSLQRDIAQFEKQARETSQTMREFLWNEDDGYFYDRNVATGNFIKFPTVASLIPLLAGVPNNHQWLKLREHIVNPKEFFTAIPIPSVAHSEPLFEKDCWRGPVWVNTAYMVIKGFQRYGDRELGRTLAEKLVDGVYKTWGNTGKFVEYYDPDAFDFTDLTRKKGLGPLGLSAAKNPLTVITQLITKRLILASKPVAHFVGWTGLVNTLVIDDLQDRVSR